jgi:phosphoribosyl 1,2-cyclic phosphodiesterase
VRLTFLGTGTSFGVPQIGCPCAVCHSADPRDRRTRVGALVETDAGRRILIDTPPELRLQLVAAASTASTRCSSRTTTPTTCTASTTCARSRRAATSR